MCAHVPKPNYYGTLVSDPNFALPYFARVADLPEEWLEALAEALAPYL